MIADMKKYYLARRECEPSVLGVNNGIKQADIRRDGYTHPEKFDDLSEKLGSSTYWQVKDLIPLSNFELECVRLLRKAKLTNFLRFGPTLINCPFLVSAPVADLFQGFKLQPHSLFPARVEAGSKVHPFFLLYLIPHSFPLFDYSKSVFITGDEFRGETPHTFTSREEHSDFCRANIGLHVKLAVLSEDASALDFLSLDGSEIVITARLKAALESQGLTSGLKILPAFGDVPWPVVASAL